MKAQFVIAITLMIFVNFSSCKQEKEIAETNRIIEEATMVKTVKVANFSDSGIIKTMGIVLSDNEARPSFKTGVSFTKHMLKKELCQKGAITGNLNFRRN